MAENDEFNNKTDTNLINKSSNTPSISTQDRSNTSVRSNAHEEKLRIARERQNEERQKKIEELKAQAEAAQKYREQKEEERRQRIKDLRNRDLDKRQQVEERKRAIEEAEKERREYILKKNMERDSRIEVKKRNERNLIGFAFGSSTPRLLDPADFGTVSPSSYWGHRRSTSISNVSYGSGATLTRRSSERELSDGAKKRATSAGAERNDEIETVDSSHFCRSVYRRKTDLMPTIPSPRDHSHYFGSKSSICNTPRTPGRAVSMIRLDQLAQPVRRCGVHVRAIEEREKQDQLKQQMITEQHNLSKSLTHLGGGFPSSPGAFGTPTTNRPLRRHGSTTKSMIQLQNANRFLIANKKLLSRNNFKTEHIDDNLILLVASGSGSGDVTPRDSRPGSALSTSTNFSLSTNIVKRSAITRRPRPISIAGTGVSPSDDKQKKPPTPSKPMTTPKRQTTSNSKISSVERKTPVTKNLVTTRTPSRTPSLSKSSSAERLSRPKDLMSVSCVGKIESNKTKEEKNALNSKTTIKTISKSSTVKPAEELPFESLLTNLDDSMVVIINDLTPVQNLETISKNSESGSFEEKTDKGNEKKKKRSRENSEVRDITDAMSAFMIAKKITTEEEAKAALAERRRLAREEAERQAELERQKLKAEKQAELKKQQEEEEKQRKFEEEANRVAEQARLAEEMRLKQAIEEAEKREEAERKKRYEEERLKNEKEEAEKKAKEDAEKLRLETAERLKEEEKAREERRKRVEQIMLRTRKSNASTPSKPSEQPKSTETDAKPVEDERNGDFESHAPQLDSTEQNQKIQTQDVSTKLAYEQSVKEKENSLLNSFSNMLIGDNNTKNLQQNNGHGSLIIMSNHTNGNGHFQDIKKDTSSMMVDLPSPNTLIDVSIGDSNNTASQQQIFTNNNSLLVTTTGDSYDNKDISLL